MITRLTILCFALCCLTSCFDVYETITVKNDGSGVYEQKMDMSRMLTMAALMGGGQTSAGKERGKMDTLISYRDVADTMKGISAEERKVMSAATLRMQLNEEAGEMNFTITYPFANEKEFALIQELMAKPEMNRAMSSMAAGMFGKPSEQLGQATQEKQPELPANGFTYTLSKNKLIKKVKPFTTAETPVTETDGIPAEMKEMMKFNYYTTINLPKPVKTWSGNNGTLSADKKQLKFSKSIDMDSRPTPADFDFSIEF